MWLLAGCGSDDPTPGERRAEQASDAARQAGLDDEVADVIALAASSVDAIYRVAYDQSPAADGGATRVVLTQRPPQLRVDTIEPDGDTTSLIRDGNDSYQCRQTAGSWRCHELGADPGELGAIDPEAVAAVVESLTERAEFYDFAVEERELIGIAAECLVTTRRPDAPDDAALGESATLCVTDIGAVLLAETPSGAVTAVEYATDVDDEAFELPVPADG